jgi:hypothetical protein
MLDNIGKPTSKDELQHRRVAAFHRESVLPEEVMLQSAKELEQSIVEQHRKRHAQQCEANKHLAMMYAPLIDLLNKDKRAVEGMQSLREMTPPALPQRPAPPIFPKVKPAITSGSLLSFIGPPYDFDSHNSHATGGDIGEELADRFSGFIYVVARGNNGRADAYGMVSMALHPIAEDELVRFSPFVKYGYQWSDHSDFPFELTHNYGSIGVYVTRYDLNGKPAPGDEAVNFPGLPGNIFPAAYPFDNRITLWSNSTGSIWENLTQSSSSDQDGNYYTPIQILLPVSSRYIYVFSVYSALSVDESSLSQALASNWVNIPWVVFEQYPL